MNGILEKDCRMTGNVKKEELSAKQLVIRKILVLGRYPVVSKLESLSLGNIFSNRSINAFIPFISFNSIGRIKRFSALEHVVDNPYELISNRNNSISLPIGGE